MRSFNSRGTNALYDETVRVPLVLSGYNIIPKKIIKNLIRQVDIFPTLLDLAEINFEKKNIDGRSFISLFKNEKLDNIPAYLETGINLGLLLNKKPETLGKIIGVRTNSFKYWRARKNPQEECYLFDLENDPNEDKNISKALMKPNVAKKSNTKTRNIHFCEIHKK